ncbi:MAG: DUF3387 domain-containing protein [Bacteroidales bacterium]|nr:DUF3387 domain-containing protein [Bacteroidales bacterium]
MNFAAWMCLRIKHSKLTFSRGQYANFGLGQRLDKSNKVHFIIEELQNLSKAILEMGKEAGQMGLTDFEFALHPALPNLRSILTA